MHRSAGLRLEQAWRDRSDAIAAELAMHFERGREWPRAVRYLQTAASHATAQYAHREAANSQARADNRESQAKARTGIGQGHL